MYCSGSWVTDAEGLYTLTDLPMCLDESCFPDHWKFIWSNSQVVKALDSKSRGLELKTTGGLQSKLLPRSDSSLEAVEPHP